MTSGPENRFIKSINDKLKGKLHCEKMNNPYRGGTADVWYSGKRDAWIEYKWINSVPKKGVLVPDLSGLQVVWLGGRHKEGRTVFVVVGCPMGAIIFSNPAEWTDGLDIAKIQPVPKPEFALWIIKITGAVDADNKSVAKRRTKHGEPV